MRFLIVLIGLLLLAACGGGGGGSRSPDPLPQFPNEPAPMVRVSNEFGSIKVFISTYWDYSSGQGVDTGIPFVAIEFARDYIAAETFNVFNFTLKVSVFDHSGALLATRDFRRQLFGNESAADEIIEDVPTAEKVSIDSWSIRASRWPSSLPIG